MVFDITSCILGAAAGALVMAALAYPRVGRILSRVFAVTAMAGGAGLLTWALQAVIGGGTLQAFQLGQLLVAQPGEALGWSAALLAGGITALVLSFLGGSAR